MLLSVFKELQGLETWRASLVALLRRLGNMRRAGGDLGDVDDLEQQEKGFGQHMSSVNELNDSVMAQVFANVSRCFELGTTNPQVLVMT